MRRMLLSIPSPHTGVVHLGPLAIRMYGLMLLVGIAGCIWLTGVRWVRRGGDWDLVFRVAVWGVGFGIVGARLYHDITSWSEVQAIDKWWAPFAVWKGGLGVWGGIFLGCLAGAVVVRRSGNSVYTFGRFFEELLRIDPSHHIAGLRLNAWVSIVLFVLSTAFFIWWQFFHRGSKEPLPPPKRTTGPAMAIPRGRR